MPRMGDDGQTPVCRLVHWDEDEVLREHVEVLGPAGHQCVPFLLVALLQQLRVEHAAKGMQAALIAGGQSEHEVLHPQVDEVVVEVHARTQPLQVPSTDRYHVLCVGYTWSRVDKPLVRGVL